MENWVRRFAWLDLGLALVIAAIGVSSILTDKVNTGLYWIPISFGMTVVGGVALLATDRKLNF